MNHNLPTSENLDLKLTLRMSVDETALKRDGVLDRRWRLMDESGAAFAGAAGTGYSFFTERVVESG